MLNKIVETEIMMYQEYQAILSKMPIFKGIQAEELKELLDCLKPRMLTYKKNDYIAIAGNKLDGIGCVLKGDAAVMKENAAGNRVIMAMLKPGETFGEIAAFSREHTWPATVQAQDNCVVLFLPPSKIISNCERVCQWHKVIIQNMLGILSEKALMLNRKVEYLTIKSMRGKISAFLLEQYKRSGSATFMLPMNRNELADFLNVSRPSMSREMAHMKDEGIIDFHMSSIRIEDLEALKSMLE